MAIKDYEVIKQIGSGGMGAVFLARDPRLDRLVAIKKTKIPVNIAKDVHTEVVQRFYREARAVANLNHPNIVTVYELGEDSDTKECYMVMEYLEGKSLEKMLEEQKYLSVSIALKIGIQVCEALAYMHQKQLVHRDIKPGNLIYCDSGMLKLTDFGLVRMDDKLDLTRAGTLLGSVLYMSPEQIENPKNVDHRVDMYAFGVTMYQILSGEFPYNGENVWEVITKVTTGEPIPLSKVNPAISKELEKIIMKSLSKRKENRYVNMNELQEALVNYNMLNVQTVVSPLSYAKFTSQIPALEEARKAALVRDANAAQVKPDVSKAPTNPGLLKTEHLASANVLNPDLIRTELSIPVEKTEERTHIKIKASSFVERIDEVKTSDIKTFDYPVKLEVDDLSSEVGQKQLNHLRFILSKLTEESKAIENSNLYLEKLTEDLTEDIKNIHLELKELVLDYNLGVTSVNLSADQKFELKEQKKKIDLRKLQKTSKENELNLIREKLNTYKKFHFSKKIRKEITSFIIDKIGSLQITSFFDDGCTIFSLPEKKADGAKEIILTKLNTLVQIDNFIKDMSLNSEYFKKNISTSGNFASAGSVIRFLPKNNVIEVKLTEDLDTSSMLEIDLEFSETLFVNFTIIHNNKYVPKVQGGNIVLLKSDSFVEEMRKKIKTNSQFFKAKSRPFRKSIADDELKAYEILAEVNRKDEPTPEDSCVLDSAKERLKLLYAELNHRAILYEDY